jgi:hypothetical protein
MDTQFLFHIEYVLENCINHYKAASYEFPYLPRNNQ